LRRSPLLAVFLTVVIDLLGFGIVLPLLPLYAKRYDASELTIGLLFASFSGMQFLAAPLWGRLSDRIGRRPVILVGLFGSLASYTLFGLADATSNPLAILFVSRLTAGLFGGTISTAYAYISDVTSTAERGRGMALIGAAFGIGFTLGPLVGGFGGTISLALPGFLAAGFSATAFVFAWFRLPEPERRQSRARIGSWSAFRQAVAAPGVFRILVLTFLAHGCFALFETTLALVADIKFAFGLAENGGLFSYLGFWSAFAQGFLVRRLMKPVGERRLAMLGAVLLSLGLLAVGQAGSVVLLLVAAPLPVFGFTMLTPSLASILSKIADPSVQGGTFGMNQSAASLARIAGPLAGNAMLGYGRRHAFPISLPHAVGAAVMVLGFLIAIGLRRAPPATTTPAE
jgi:DHA1 family tetracycline resistance protein-like MFS transporter